jgi:formyl-CoA transferase
MTETPGSIRRRAPLLGEDTEEILRTIGCAPGDIATWRQADILR